MMLTIVMQDPHTLTIDLLCACSLYTLTLVLLDVYIHVNNCPSTRLYIHVNNCPSTRLYIHVNNCPPTRLYIN